METNISHKNDSYEQHLCFPFSTNVQVNIVQATVTILSEIPIYEGLSLCMGLPPTGSSNFQ